MLTIRHSLSSIGIALFSALSINIALAGPVEDGGTLTCSDDTSKANINDIRFPGTGVGNNDYLEVFILEQDVDITDWQLCYTFSGGSGNDCIELGQGNLNEYFYGNPQGDDADPDTFNTGTYLEYEVPNNKSLNPDEGEVLLVNNIDGVDVVVDYIQYCQAATCDPPRWDVPAACGFTLTGHDAGNKDIARLPDGDGDFGDNGDEVTRGDTNDDSAPTSLFGFTMDEPVWNGSPGEVIDPTGSTSGTATNGAVTSTTDPAIPGSPGSCGYGSFDGVDDYISISPLNPPNGEDEVEISNSITLTAWVQTNNNSATQTIFSFQDDSDFVRLSVSPTGKLTYNSNLLTPNTLSSADGVLANDTWYFVSLVIDLGNNTINLYAATQADAIGLVATNTLAIAGGEDEFELEIEDSGDLTIGGGPSLNSFSGFIDEFNLFGGPLNIGTLEDVKAITRPCTVTGPAHYAISHDGNGISCLAESITITGHDSSDNPVAVPAATTINLSTIVNGNPALNLGDWTVVGSGTGTLTNGALGDGAATYTFPGGETNVVLQFNYTNPNTNNDTVNFNVSDGSLVESTTEDPDLVYQQTALVFENTTDANQTITTQISGKDSNVGFGAKDFFLSAIQVSDSSPAVCTGLYTNQTVAIDLGAECINPSSCAGNQLSINGTAINTTDESTATSFSPVSLVFDGSSRAPLILNYPDAGQLRLDAQSQLPLADGSPSSDTLSISSNPFVVRPFGFSFSDIRNYGADTTYDTGDDVTTITGTASGGVAFIAAEDVFRVTVTAHVYNSTQELLDGGGNPTGQPTPTADLSANATTPNFASSTTVSALTTSGFTPATGAAGAVGGSNIIAPVSYTLGVATSAGNLTYNEVGSVTLQSNALDYISSGIDIIGYSPSVGRFFPDHFTLTAGNVTPAIGSFTYMGQELGIDYVLEARGLAGSLTQNYDDALGYAGTAEFETAAEDNNDGIALDARIGNPPLSTNWSNGVYTYSSTTESFARSAGGPDGPYQSLQFSTRVTTEMDNRLIENHDEKTDQANDCVADSNCTSKAIGSLTDVRFGRLRVVNAFGSELVPLPIPFIAEYFVTDGTGGGFFPVTVDSTTSYSAAASGDEIQPVTLSNPTGNLMLADTTVSGAGVLVSGLSDPALPISLSPPGVGNDGSVDVTFDVPAYLEFDWDGDGNHDNDPTATATFGIFSGNDSTIYLRELY